MLLIYLPFEHVFPCYDNTDFLLLTIVDQGQPPSPVCSPTHPLIQPTNQPSKSSQVLHISILLMWKESDGKTTEVATFFVRNLT